MKKFIKQLYLNLIWQAALRRWRKDQPKVIAISGSAGKTTTKEAVASILESSPEVAVFKTPGNMNTDSGIALSLLGFKEAPSGWGWVKLAWRILFPPRILIPKKGKNYYVLEYSADKPGDIAFLTNKIPPEIVVLTSIVPVHMQNYSTFADLVREKLTMLEGCQPEGYLILNSDDPNQVYWYNQNHPSQTVYWFGVNKDEGTGGDKIGVFASHITNSLKGLRCQISFQSSTHLDNIGKNQNQTINVQLHILGKHQLYSLLAATGIGMIEKIELKKIQKVLGDFEMPPGRGRLLEGIKEIKILDDTYNASPETVKDGLTMAREIAGRKRLVAILGRMNELGEMATQAHIEVGEFAAGKVDFLVTVGEYAELMQKAVIKAGLPTAQTISFRTVEQLVDRIDQVIQKEDLIYLKGSQNGVRLERIVKELLAHPSEAKILLVRQDKYWRNNERK
jgi:UDP-N-acetylmuramyl pentapeptide synthase